MSGGALACCLVLHASLGVSGPVPASRDRQRLFDEMADAIRQWQAERQEFAADLQQRTSWIAAAMEQDELAMIDRGKRSSPPVRTVILAHGPPGQRRHMKIIEIVGAGGSKAPTPDEGDPATVRRRPPIRGKHSTPADSPAADQASLPIAQHRGAGRRPLSETEDQALRLEAELDSMRTLDAPTSPPPRVAPTRRGRSAGAADPPR